MKKHSPFERAFQEQFAVEIPDILFRKIDFEKSNLETRMHARIRSADYFQSSIHELAIDATVARNLKEERTSVECAIGGLVS